MSRRPISLRLRWQVFTRDKFTCHYCNKAGGELELDHIIPVSDGGVNSMDNLVTACVSCNRGKAGEAAPPTKAHDNCCPHCQDQGRDALMVYPALYERLENEGYRATYRCRNRHKWTCWWSWDMRHSRCDTCGNWDDTLHEIVGCGGERALYAFSKNLLLSVKELEQAESAWD